MSTSERELLLHIARRARHADGLVTQLLDADLQVGPSEIEISVPSTVAPVDLPDGPVDVRAAVNGPGGEPVGEILLWVREGRLVSAEYAWYTDEPPATWPAADQITFE